MPNFNHKIRLFLVRQLLRLNVTTLLKGPRFKSVIWVYHFEFNCQNARLFFS